MKPKKIKYEIKLTGKQTNIRISLGVLVVD